MKNFCVSYDLVGGDRYCNYNLIEDALLKLNGERIQKSVWILILDDSWNHKRLEKCLTNYFNKDDSLFISRISK